MIYYIMWRELGYDNDGTAGNTIQAKYNKAKGIRKH